ncbi:MAG: hypothetical protein ACYC2Y_10500 [Armatimonadota bacterium]
MIGKLLKWRLVYGGLLLLTSAWGLSPVARGELGAEPSLYLLLLGVLPSAAVVASARRGRLPYRLALAHDLFLAIALLVSLVLLHNRFGLIILSPLGAFILEGLVLLVLSMRCRWTDKP